MPRYRGVGMPRAKKKAVAVAEVVDEVPTPPPEPAEPPPPPSTPPRKSKPVKAESPSKSVLLTAQRRARSIRNKLSKKTAEKMERANAMLEAEDLLFGRRIKELQRLENLKLPVKKPPASQQLQKASKAEMCMERARYNHLMTKYEVATELHELYEAELVVQERKIARLERQLRVARRAKKRRRGWSTTMVRFLL